MREIEDIIEQYDSTEKVDRRKVEIIKWFQKRPRLRFDINEIHDELGDELGVGKGQTRNYLNELVDEDVLQAHGDKRKGYQLADDIAVLARYRVRAALEHLAAVLDIGRWGVTGYITMATVLWAILTIPFWFMGVSLLVTPSSDLVGITQSEFLLLAGLMTAWLIILVVISGIVHAVSSQY